MATEQKAFAAVRTRRDRKERIWAATMQNRARDARLVTGSFFINGWQEAKRHGWRIRPVIIRLEEQDNDL